MLSLQALITVSKKTIISACHIFGKTKLDFMTRKVYNVCRKRKGELIWPKLMRS